MPGTPLLDLREAFARCRKLRLEACEIHPTPKSHVHVGAIDLEAEGPPARALGGENRRARAQKSVKHDIAAARHILNHIGDQIGRLDRGVAFQIVLAAAKAVHRGRRPHVRAIAAMPAKFDVVHVLAIADHVDENHLVAAAVQRAHPSVRLRPDRDVQAPSERRFPSSDLLARMMMVHEHERHGPVPAVRCHQDLCLGEESRELFGLISPWAY